MNTILPILMDDYLKYTGGSWRFRFKKIMGYRILRIIGITICNIRKV
jgi:hypothetical protein